MPAAVGGGDDQPRDLLTQPDPIAHPRWSPKAGDLGFVSGAERIWVADLASGDARALTLRGIQAHCPLSRHPVAVHYPPWGLPHLAGRNGPPPARIASASGGPSGSRGRLRMAGPWPSSGTSAARRRG